MDAGGELLTLMHGGYPHDGGLSQEFAFFRCWIMFLLAERSFVLNPTQDSQCRVGNS